jgi:DNA-directed RNA polymerase specialized sigma24 family protein
MKPNRAFQESKEARIRQTFRAELFRFVPKRVRDETLAEDIVRDAFIT